MNRNTVVVIAVFVVILVGGSIGLAARNSADNKSVSDLTASKENITTPASNTAQEPSISEVDSDNKPGSFSEYDQAKLANAEDGTVVLFFSASWCPTCREANKNFNGTATPAGLTLLKLDYDNSTDLKKKYGVTYQHTFVQVDKNGNLLKKWGGSTSYEELLKQSI